VSSIVVGRWKKKGGVFVLIFICGIVEGGEEAVICYDKSVVIEEI